MGKVKVMITNNQTEVKIPVGIRLLVRRCCHAVLEYEGHNDDFEVSVSFVNDEQIHELNKEHRNIDRSTDVLSFPLGENGDFDMNHETGAFLLGEIGFLTVHSMLHLLGYDHEESNLQERIMREKEEAILGNLGISRDATFLGEHEHR